MEAAGDQGADKSADTPLRFLFTDPVVSFQALGSLASNAANACTDGLG